MIDPYSSEVLKPLYVKDEARRNVLLEEAEKIPSTVISSAAAANAVMLGGGYFNPLSGYMDLADVIGVAERMQMSSGLFWPTPVVNMLRGNSLCTEIKSARKIALRDPNVEGNPVIAVQTVEKIEIVTEKQIGEIIKHVYGTTDREHPGVAAFTEAGDTLISGPIEVLNFSYFSTEFPDTFRTAVEIRNEIKEREWETVFAFQTRNPMHMSHEYLVNTALETCDGVMIHSTLGELKPGDIPAEVRSEAISTLIDNYFVENTVLQSGYPLDMRYAGPREALLHALFRQNYGCSHLIVGRDHAGIGDYYGPFDAHNIFDEIGGALLTQPLKLDWSFWCYKCADITSMDICPHSNEDRLLLSGSKLRYLLSENLEVPENFSRVEVLTILRKYYASIKEDEKVNVELKGHSAR